MPGIIIKLHKHRDMGTMTINLAEITAKTAEDIKEQVEEMISRQNQVVSVKRKPKNSMIKMEWKGTSTKRKHGVSPF